MKILVECMALGLEPWLCTGIVGARQRVSSWPGVQRGRLSELRHADGPPTDGRRESLPFKAQNDETAIPPSSSRKTAQKPHSGFLEFTQVWWAQRDLNPRPSDYESPALTAELWAPPTVSYKHACDDKASKPNREAIRFSTS
jgi:hypothetical protein